MAYRNAPIWQNFGTIIEGECPQAGVSNIKANFSCPGQVTVTYDLSCTQPTNVQLKYSPDGGKTWLTAHTISGDVYDQTSGAGKTIVWDNRADNVRWGKFKVKVVVPQPPKPECVMIDGVCWATCNLATHGTFADNPEDYGALFQWGRQGDGHEQRTSPNYPTNDTSTENGIVSGAANFDANGQIISTHTAYGKFIKQYNLPCNWRSPQNDSFWNAGNEAVPVKTANDPCPAGWRVPSQTEYASLVAAGSVWTTVDGVNGRLFGSGNNALFLPAAGNRFDQSGTILNVGTNGYYWSSSSNSGASANGAYNLNFTASNVSLVSSRSAIGYCIRCVKE
jgi:uncharacterized protein (TIGR02145 family)